MRGVPQLIFTRLHYNVIIYQINKNQFWHFFGHKNLLLNPGL